MTDSRNWQRYCESLRIFEETGLSLDFSKMDCPADFFSRMHLDAQRALSAMERLERGEIANPEENRMVGHYWLRSPELAPSAEIRAEITAVLEQIKDFAARVHRGAVAAQNKAAFENVLLIGIGGSALGPQLVSDALWQKEQRMRMFYFDNTDPDGVARTLTQIGNGLDKTLSIVISKSGGTIETRNGALEAAHAYKDAGLDFARHAVCITCRASKLDAQAHEERWLERFYMWDWVGGRTSMFSAVGLLPAALQGIDIDSFIAGAGKMDELTRQQDYSKNPAALLALMWHHAGGGRGAKDMVILPYKDRLCLFSRYLQQLIMESLGKEKDLSGKVVNQGIAVYGNKGSTDQHAYVQQLREGINNFFVTFIEVLTDYCKGSGPASYMEVEPAITSGDYLTGFYLGTQKALAENGRASMTITLDELTPFTLGALIALYERAVGLYAALINVNAYHQPGVEAGKKAAAQVIAIQRRIFAELQKQRGNSSGFSVVEIADKIGADAEFETVYKILEHLAANPARQIKRLGARDPQTARYVMT